MRATAVMQTKTINDVGLVTDKFVTCMLSSNFHNDSMVLPKGKLRTP